MFYCNTFKIFFWLTHSIYQLYYPCISITFAFYNTNFGWDCSCKVPESSGMKILLKPHDYPMLCQEPLYAMPRVVSLWRVLIVFLEIVTVSYKGYSKFGWFLQSNRHTRKCWKNLTLNTLKEGNHWRGFHDFFFFFTVNQFMWTTSEINGNVISLSHTEEFSQEGRAHPTAINTSLLAGTVMS